MVAKSAANRKLGRGRAANLGFEQAVGLATEPLFNFDATEPKHVSRGQLF